MNEKRKRKDGPVVEAAVVPQLVDGAQNGRHFLARRSVRACSGRTISGCASSGGGTSVSGTGSPGSLLLLLVTAGRNDQKSDDDEL